VAEAGRWERSSSVHYLQVASSSGGQPHRVLQDECSSGASALPRSQLTDRKRSGPLTSRT